MLWLKLAGPIFLLLSVGAQHSLDYIWHDKRTKVHHRIRVVLICFQIIVGVLTIIVVANEHKTTEKQNITLDQISKQVVVLNGQLTPFIQLALKKYPNLPESTALDQLATEIADLKYRTSSLEKSISDFSVSVQLVLSGDWIESLSHGPEFMLTALFQEEPYVRFIHRSGNHQKDILCFLTAGERRREASGNVIVDVNATVHSGSWPLGKTIDQLVGYDLCEIGVAVTREIVKSPIVNLKRSKLTVFINGVSKVAYDDSPNAPVSIPPDGYRVLEMKKTDMLASAFDSRR